MTSQGLGQAMIALLAAAAIALILSLVLLSRYRSRLVALMNEDRGSSRAAAPPDYVPEPKRPIRLEIIQSETDDASLGNKVFADVINGPSEALKNYAIGVSLFAAVMAAAYLAAEDIFSATRWLVVFVILAWPVVIVALLIVPPAARLRQSVTIGYGVIALAVLLFAALISPNVGVFSLVVSWFIFNTPPTLILLAFMSRRIRAVGPLTLVYALVCLTGAIMAVGLLDSLTSGSPSDIALRLFGMAAAADVSSLEILFWFVVIGLSIAALIGWTRSSVAHRSIPGGTIQRSIAFRRCHRSPLWPVPLDYARVPGAMVSTVRIRCVRGVQACCQDRV